MFILPFRNENRPGPAGAKRRLLFPAFALTAALILFFVPLPRMTACAQSTSGSCGSNCRWSISGDYNNKTLTITGSGPMDYYSTQRPWDRFSGEITKVSIDPGITSIGYEAFSGLSKLTAVTFGEGSRLARIGGSAFDLCTSLTSITIPAGVTEIGSTAFASSGLTSVTIPAGVTSIGPLTFSGCKDLEEVIFSDGSLVGSIRFQAFANCTSLRAFSIPASLTDIDTNALIGCSGLETINVDSGNTKYSAEGGVLFDKNRTALIRFPEGKSGDYVVPGTVTSIGDRAFNGCGKLTSVTLPAGVESIGDVAFAGCAGLPSLTIPASVTSIGRQAFSGCTGLTGNVTILRGGKDLSFGERVFQMTEIKEAAVRWDGLPEGRHITVSMDPGDAFTIDSLPDGTASVGWTAENPFPAKLSASLAANTYTVVFDKNAADAEGSMDPQNFTYGESQNLTAVGFTLDNYNFSGWSTAKDGDVEYTDGQDGSAIPAAHNGTVTLYAQWTEIIYKVTVSDDGNGTASASPSSGPHGTEVTLSAEPGGGYVFDKWQVISGGVTIENDKFTIGSSDVEIKALFAATPKPLSDPSVKAKLVPGDSFTYTGQEFEVAVEVRDGDSLLTEGVDYEITADSVLKASEVGTYKVTISADDKAAADESAAAKSVTGSNYTGSLTLTWRITPGGTTETPTPTPTPATETPTFVPTTETPAPTSVPATETPEPECRPVCCGCRLPATGFSSRQTTVLPEQPKELRYASLRMRLMIPSLNTDTELVTVPLAGKDWPVDWLGSRAGILEGSALPGEGLSIIAAHNTLNDTDFGPFAMLAAAEVNDMVMVRADNGAPKLFRVFANELLAPDDTETLAAIAGREEDVLVLVTCENESPDGGYLSRRVFFAKPVG